MQESEKKSIEIDLEIHQFIELRRISFSESQNDILRRILELDLPDVDRVAGRQLPPPFGESGRENISFLPSFSVPMQKKSLVDEVKSLSERIKKFHSGVSGRQFSSKPPAARDWYFAGVRLPEGTRLEKWYGGKKYEAEIRDGAIWFDGLPYQTPSAAAMVITGGSNVSGWNFWKFFDPVDGRWKKLISLKSGQQDQNDEVTKI